jgi:hypothetical protein
VRFLPLHFFLGSSPLCVFLLQVGVKAGILERDGGLGGKEIEDSESRRREDVRGEFILQI